MKEEKKDFIEIRYDSIKQRIRYLDSKDPGKQDLDALMKRMSQNFSKKEKPKSLIQAVKQRIKYLEVNDPNHVTLELVKERISDNISTEDKI